jgi:hypothetical protein
MVWIGDGWTSAWVTGGGWDWPADIWAAADWTTPLANAKLNPVTLAAPSIARLNEADSFSALAISPPLYVKHERLIVYFSHDVRFLIAIYFRRETTLRQIQQIDGRILLINAAYR